MKTEIKKLGKSEIELLFEMPAEDFAKYIDKALEHLKSHMKMDGFRKGQVPKEMVEKKMGVENLLMEAGDLAVKAAYTNYVKENNLEPVSEPNVEIKKIAKGSPFEFVVTVAVLPELPLPDYKEISSKIKGNEVSVDEKEIQETLEYLQKSRAKFTDETTGAENKNYVKIEYQSESINGGKPVKDMFILGEGAFLSDFEKNLLGMKMGEEKEFTAKFPENTPNSMAGKSGNFKVKMLAVQTMELPEINDEFAKGLGMFDSLVALKNNLKEGITSEKRETEKQRKRGELLTKIAEKITFELPEKMVQHEQERLFEDMKHHVSRQFNMTLEQYLQNVKKTEAEVKASYQLEAEKRIKDFLVLRQIGKAERIEVTKEELEEEVNRELKKYPPEQADKVDIGRLKEYSKSAVFNEKVFNLLETFSK